MGKKKSKKAFVLKPWCWYCEREFEDEKVLLQHQKAKHFKCNHCPRKLNTAGGLMVHCQQVHKTEPDKLPNTLPGRDGYDVEIFGMEGVPAKDQADWRAKKEAEAGFDRQNSMNQQTGIKRPRIWKGVLSEADLQVALSQHKALMSGNKTGLVMPPGGMPPMGMMPPMPGQPPFMPFAGAPPPGMSFPPGGFPPPGFPPQGMPFPPPMGMPPQGFPPGIRPPFPPPGLAGSPAMPIPGVSPVPGIGSPATPGHAGSPFPPGARPSLPPAAVPTPSAEDLAVQPPRDGVMWPDDTASPAEKRAKQARYRYVSPSPADGQTAESLDSASRKRKAAADFL